MGEYAVTIPPATAMWALLEGLPEADQLILALGSVEQTVGTDTQPLPALVLTDADPSHGQVRVWAQPVALLHLKVDDSPIQEVVCVDEDTEPTVFTTLATSPDGQMRLRQAVAHAYSGRRIELTGIEDVWCAERLLDCAWFDSLRASQRS